MPSTLPEPRIILFEWPVSINNRTPTAVPTVRAQKNFFGSIRRTIDAQNKTNTNTSYITSYITITIFIIIKILMPIIQYDANTIRGRDRSIHLYYYRHLRLSLRSNNQYNVLREWYWGYTYMFFVFFFIFFYFLFVYRHRADCVFPWHFMLPWQSLFWPQ